MSTQSITAVLHPDAQTFRAILVERARILAQVPLTERQGNTMDLVVLQVGQNKYGVELESVEAIQHLRSLTPIPGLPTFWKGVVNLRGRLLPVLDLKPYLKLADKPDTDAESSPELVVVTANRLSICLLVDRVDGTQTVFVDEIAPPLNATSLSGNEFVIGSAPGLIAVLDIKKVLSDTALVVQDGMQ